MRTPILSRISFRSPPFKILLITLFGGLALMGCSRSQWIQIDGHEVSKTEQLKCAQQVQQQNKEKVFEQDVLEQKIKQCLLDKGYKRRPWWLLNDLHWHIKQPTF